VAPVAGSVITACGPLPACVAAGRWLQPDRCAASQVSVLSAEIVSSWLLATKTVCRPPSIVSAQGRKPTGIADVCCRQPECRRALQIAVLITETVESVLLAV